MIFNFTPKAIDCETVIILQTVVQRREVTLRVSLSVEACLRGANMV